LRLEREPVGLCEFDGVGKGDIELKHFGLIPGAQGYRLGPYLLDWALRSIWQDRPGRIWLHTDTNDHPKARSVYARAGFNVFAEEWTVFPD
jgi:GNAT superfamily N-acetyltransferase